MTNLMNAKLHTLIKFTILFYLLNVYFRGSTMDKKNVSPQPTSHTRQTLVRLNRAHTSNIAKGK